MRCSPRAPFSALLLLVLATTGCVRLPELGNLSYLAPRERARSVLSAIEPSTSSSLALHELQLKGSHNSYHRAPRIALSRTWRYSHAPLEVQLASQGVRQLELDVRYARGELLVGHLPVVDGRSTCTRLIDCLARVKQWSRAHPQHLPVFIFLEVKEDLAPSRLDGKLDALDFAITRVFSRDMLLIPEDVAGDAPSLRAAITAKGWPSLDSTRGRVAFVMFGPKRHKTAYAAGRPRLDGRMMFVAERKPDYPHASIVFYDDPVKQRDAIARAVASNLLVRTRADTDLHRRTAQRDAALASGAHFISSDFVDPRYNWLELGHDTAGRCNPLSASKGCSPLALSESHRPALAKHEPKETPSATRAD